MLRRSMQGLGGLVTGGFLACAVGMLPVGGAAGEAKGDDPAGSWKLKFVSCDGQTRESLLTLSREGTTLKGAYTADSVTQPARDVGFERGELSFRVDGEYAGQSYTLNYKGKPRGDIVRGAVRWKFGWASGCFDFEGRRVERPAVANR